MTEEKGCVKCGHTEIEEGTLSAQDQVYRKCLMFSTITLKQSHVRIVVIPSFTKKVLTVQVTS